MAHALASPREATLYLRFDNLQFTIVLSSLDLDLNTAGELQFHQRLNRLVVAVVDVNQTLETCQLELLTRFLIYEGGAVHGEDTLVGRQWNRTTYHGTCSLHCLNDFLGGVVHQVVVERCEFDTNVFIRD